MSLRRRNGAAPLRQGGREPRLHPLPDRSL